MIDKYGNMIREVFRRLKLPPPEKISTVSGRVVNPCYEINDAWVIRFNIRDTEIPKFSNEYQAYKLCLAHNLPVPRNIHYLTTAGGTETIIAEFVSNQ